MFFALDFVLFGLFLLLSLLVGLWHNLPRFVRPSLAASSSNKSDPTGDPSTLKHSSANDFLDGGRRLPILPVCLSLLTTFVSGIGLLSTPAEIYSRGSAFALFNLCGSFAFALIGIFFLPIFFKLKCLNAYEYFELRFQSQSLRRLATLVFMVNTLFYMAVVIYAPAIALSGVTSLRLWPFVLLVGVVSTIYTAAGGIRAVIWTDTLQAGFIYGGLAVIIVRGTAQAGGLTNVLAINQQTGRLWSAFRVHPSLLQYNNLWVAMFGGILQWTCIYGLNQMAMQRYCSMPSLRHARVVLSLTMPANLLIQLMIGYIGLLMAAYFDQCNPLALGEVETVDQVTILMASRIFEGVPGLPGLFLATIFSATLSTASSGINSLTAVLWEDFLKVPLKDLSDAHKSCAMKGISVFFGALATVMAFACSNLGGIFNVVLTIIGATSGPLVGLFFLGIFFPRANKIGAFVAFFLSTFLLLFCTFMSNVQKPYQNYALTEYASNSSKSGACVNYEENEAQRRANESALFMSTFGAQFHFGTSDSSVFSKLSPFCYSSLGVLLVIFIGLPISCAFRQRQSQAEKKLTFACTYFGLEKPIERKQSFGEEIGQMELQKQEQSLSLMLAEEAQHGQSNKRRGTDNEQKEKRQIGDGQSDGRERSTK
ncbi:hypothetical protein niasHT_028000 [Heterodera trifolii]|uniref:Sodium-coupled monocarboxylate transporter 1 n=1 Tax=Heterodera trifolii TaxID=157864 RepID=A0ABD2KFH6_9BILA